MAVSGVGGFVGGHLARELVNGGHDVIGLSIGPAPSHLEGLLVDYLDRDLTRGWPQTDAEAVIHLAGLSAVGPSFADPQRYLEVNSAPVTHLCEGLLTSDATPRVVIVSTGAVYTPGVGLDEIAPTEATSPYGVSKLLVEAQSAYYRRRGVDIVVMRPFNHIGPGQQQGFVLPDLIQAVTDGVFTAGNLDTRRDYTDVRDVARAYRLAVEAPHLDTPVLNVCSATSTSGRELLALAADALGSNTPEITVDPVRIRPDDPIEISGSNTLAASKLGWRPEIGLDTTVRDTVAASMLRRT